MLLIRFETASAILQPSGLLSASGSALFTWETGTAHSGTRSASIASTDAAGIDARWTQTVTGLYTGNLVQHKRIT